MFIRDLFQPRFIGYALPPHDALRHRLLLPFAVIIFVVAAMVYFIWADRKAEGSAAFLSPPGPACPPTPKRASAKTAIVLIHGWNGGADTTWSKFPELLCQDEAFSDTELFVVNYPTYMARRQLKIGSLARWLRQTFFSDALRNYEDIHIIAHSMGGLVARSVYIQDKLGGSSKIRSIISIASPYLGAQISKLAAVLGISKDLTEDMAPEAVFLQGTSKNRRFLPPRESDSRFSSSERGRLAWDSLASSI
jgi:triacylglycerol esterase/lipase EstA (alpha/beta hydrolase family)